LGLIDTRETDDRLSRSSLYGLILRVRFNKVPRAKKP
jgi:hypothetical protein